MSSPKMASMSSGGASLATPGVATHMVEDHVDNVSQRPVTRARQSLCPRTFTLLSVGWGAAAC